MLTKNQLISAANGFMDLCKAHNEPCNIAEAMNFLRNENEVFGIYSLLENYSPIECHKIVYHFVAAIILNASMKAKIVYLYCNLGLTSFDAREEALVFFEKHY